MSVNIQAFTPLTGNTIAMSISTSSESDPVSKTTEGIANGSRVRIFNAGPNTVFVNFGESGVTAAIPVEDTGATGIPIPSGMVEIYEVGALTHIAAICDTGESATIFMTSGDGI